MIAILHVDVQLRFQHSLLILGSKYTQFSVFIVSYFVNQLFQKGRYLMKKSTAPSLTIVVTVVFGF